MAATSAAQAKRDIPAALKEAAFAALVTLGLCFPIIAYGTRQNIGDYGPGDDTYDVGPIRDEYRLLSRGCRGDRLSSGSCITFEADGR